MRARNIVIPLLLAKNAGEDGIHGRTRLQKFVFLIQQELEGAVSSRYNFIPYDYGPFSKELAEDMNRLEDEGFIQKQERRVGGNIEHVYQITDEGIDEVNELKKEFVHNEETENLSEELIDEWNSQSLKRLLSYVYYTYPAYAEESVL